MNKSLLKKNSLTLIIYNSLISLPTPLNISYWWNFGSLLGICLLMQIITGLFLSMHYSPHLSIAFNSIIHIMHNVNYGWIMRYIHLNGATFFFICIYMHIGRNLYYNSFNYMKVWMIGIMILFLLMATAFLGYVLPWGQMSFWGATVITNLLSTIPYIGQMTVQWIWGGFSINNATLNRFFSLHFICPLIIMIFVIIHLMFLHEFGSNNPLGTNSNLNKLSFYPYYLYKDLITLIILFMLILYFILLNPNFFNDPENFMKANSMVTPIHIQPEWYFLFAYSILRAIPSKFGGVLGLLCSICILIYLPMLNKFNKSFNLNIYPLNQLMFWFFLNVFILLTWTGMKPVEIPYILISQILMYIYFIYFIIYPMNIYFFNKFMMLKK
uniref:Cytochrome b n=1 Tax=Aulacus sinensis TaxID=2491146 RepID=A0A3S8V0A6_9HYME|nr:cytochrome b [Aulacus sinensis]